MSSDHRRGSASRPALLVLASTYPRWPSDPEPGFVHELSKRLVGQFHVVVLCPHAAGAKRYESTDGVEIVRYRYAPDRWERLVNDGGIITNIRRNRWLLLLVPGFVVMQAMNALYLAFSLRIRLVHAHWLVPQGAVAVMLSLLSLGRIRYVVTSHGADLFALKGRAMGWLKRLVLHRAASATVVSAAMKQALAGMVALEKVRVMPMGIDLQHRFCPDPAAERSADEILFVGRLVEKKGLRHLIAALPAIVEVRPAATLTIAGFGPEEPALRKQVADLGLQSKVDFVGAVSQADLPALYRRAAVFVAPFVRAASGDQEGLGLVLVEAAGCACPVLAGDVPAVRDVVGDRTELIVDPTDVVGLTAAIVGMLSDADAAGARARGMLGEISARFDWQHVADRYAKLLQAAAGPGS